MVSRKIHEIELTFWSKVDWSLDEDRCWPWLGWIHEYGYGRFRFTDVTGKRIVAFAHRLAYEFEINYIPSGHTIHHTCHDANVCRLGVSCLHRQCCNPAHMILIPNITVNL